MSVGLWHSIGESKEFEAPEHMPYDCNLYSRVPENDDARPCGTSVGCKTDVSNPRCGARTPTGISCHRNQIGSSCVLRRSFVWMQYQPAVACERS
jgi:hypothetical protein